MKLVFPILVLLLAFTARAEVIPSDRRITWTGNAGIPGGIPVRETIFTNLANGATYSQITNALALCPSNQVVLLAAGHYTNALGINVPTGVSLRGAGISNTIFHMTGGGYGGGDTETGMGFYMGTSMFAVRTGGSPGGTAYNIDSGYTKGSQSITLASSPGAVTGYLMELSQSNDTSFVTLVGQYGTSSFSSRQNGSRSMGQIVEITNVSGSTVSFHPPLYWTYTNTLDPEAVIWNPQRSYSGIEDLTVKCYSNQLGMVFGIGSSKYCWLKNIEVDFADRDMARLGSSFRCEIRGCNFHDSFVHASGNYDNPIMLHEKTSGTLIEDNILRRLHTSIMFNSGAAGNVVIHNYTAEVYDSGSTNVQMYDINMNHRAHPSFNLVEGNVTGQIRPDRAWGSSSHGTIFRNYVTCTSLIRRPFDQRGELQAGYYANDALRGISIDSAQNYYNIVGNILKPLNTPASVTYLAVVPDVSPTYSGHLYLLMFGQSDVGSSTYPDGTSYTNAILHGNWDSVTNGQRWDISIADTNLPSSYFHESKPTYFGGLNWPPFNPADSTTAQATNIPAGYRFIYGTNPPTAFDEPAPRSPLLPIRKSS